MLQIMKKSINAIDYSNGHNFGFGRKEYEEHKSSSNYKPEVYSYEYEKAADALNIEINIIIKDILNKKNNGFEVYDGDKKTNRKCDFKDFAIIIDRGGSFDTYRRAFTEANIPIKVESKELLFKSDVALVVKNLVKMLYFALNSDYENEYKHAFFSVARSFLYEYHDDVLFEIHKDNTFLKESFAQKIELIKEGLRFAPIKKILHTKY